MGVSPVGRLELKRERSPGREGELERATKRQLPMLPSTPSQMNGNNSVQMLPNTAAWAASGSWSNGLTTRGGPVPTLPTGTMNNSEVVPNMTTQHAFEQAAEAGAREARLNNANTHESYTLGVEIVRQSRLSAAQRRSARILPGGGDTTTAACHALGGTGDAGLGALAGAVSPAAPRDSRLKAVERAMKGRVREHIVRLNGGDGTRDVRACNLAAVRICTAVADILAAHAAQTLIRDIERATEEAAVKDATIAGLQAEISTVCRGCKRGGNNT